MLFTLFALGITGASIKAASLGAKVALSKDPNGIGRNQEQANRHMIIRTAYKSSK